jgi:sporulation protein YlmC with PRC-barrel domain
MDLYMIRRRKGWKTPQELEEAAKRSIEVAESDFPDDIRWIRSYVISEESGELGTVCIYQATSEEAVRRHAEGVGMPADEIRPIADTVIVRPDPETAEATS